MGKANKSRIKNKSENATFGNKSPIFQTSATPRSGSEETVREALVKLQELMTKLPEHRDDIEFDDARASASGAEVELKKHHFDRETLSRCLDALLKAVRNVGTLAEVVRSVQSAVGHF